MTWSVDYEIKTTTGTTTLVAEEGHSLFITGPNGVGKSSLLYQIYRITVPNQLVEILPGHRQIVFDNSNIDRLDQTIAELERSLKTSRAQFNRFRSMWGTNHLKSFIKRSIAREGDINSEIARLARSGQSTTKYIDENPSIINTINSVFLNAHLHVSFIIKDGAMLASRGRHPFNIDRLSDGERAALLLVCAILSQAKSSILLIDEPEKHLNPGIAGPLVSSAVQSRSDLAFIISTHDLELIRWVKPRQIVHLSDSALLPGSQPDEDHDRQYEIAIINADDKISDEIRESILGAKRSIIFVEGKLSSDDYALYSKLYNNQNIVAVGGWEAVVNNVKALKDNSEYAWLSVQGVIDSDGRDINEKALLEHDRIYCVDAPTIENLFMLENVMIIMADEVHKLFGYKTGQERLDAISHMLPELLQHHKSDIAHRRATWTINRMLSERKVSVKGLSAGVREVSSINITNVLRDEFSKIEHLIDHNRAIDIISKVPIKNTKIPSKVAKIIGYDNFERYKKSVMKKIGSKDTTADRLINAIKQKLPSIP